MRAMAVVLSSWEVIHEREIRCETLIGSLCFFLTFGINLWKLLHWPDSSWCFFLVRETNSSHPQDGEGSLTERPCPSFPPTILLIIHTLKTWLYGWVNNHFLHWTATAWVFTCVDNMLCMLPHDAMVDIVGQPAVLKIIFIWSLKIFMASGPPESFPSSVVYLTCTTMP